MVSIKVSIAPAHYSETLEHIKILLEKGKRESSFKIRYPVKPYNAEIVELNNEYKPVMIYQTDLMLDERHVSEQLTKFFSIMIQLQKILRVPSILIITSLSDHEIFPIIHEKCSKMGFGLTLFQSGKLSDTILTPRYILEFEEKITLSDKIRTQVESITRRAEVTVIDKERDIGDMFNQLLEPLKEQLNHLSTYLKKHDDISLNNLEHILTQIIYDYVLKAPTQFHKNYPNIPAQRRKIIKERDELICQICGESFTEEELVVDHIYPYSLGGSNEYYNLMALCEKCNSDKNKRVDYYRSAEGQYKILGSIKVFVKSLSIISDFGSWLVLWVIGEERREISIVTRT